MQKPAKTFADYLVVAISPLLIMVLVGSLAFFLIQVFYRGEMVSGVRWVMFWFVLAIVLVARIGIEQSKEHATFYGVALAIVTWIYLIYIHTAVFFGALLLAVTWFCAHKLTVDCTFINEEEDSSGEGVWESLCRTLEKSFEPPAQIRGPSQRWIKPAATDQPTTPTKFLPLPKGEGRGEGEVLAPSFETHGAVRQMTGQPPLQKLPPGVPLPKKRKPARPPGRWVVYFSLLALPLFGIGQLLLPADPEARRTGIEFLALYLAAALSLLITTSFLGMRRYLRQRFVEMSTPIAVGWVRFGVLLAAAVLILALLLPRPGATSTWHRLTYHITYKIHHSSPYALVFNAPGEGDGSPSDQPTEHTGTGTDSHHGTSGGGNQNSQNPGNQSTTPGNSGQSGQSGSGGQNGQGQGSGGGASGGSGGTGGGGGGNSSGDNNPSPGNVTLPHGSAPKPPINQLPNGNIPANGPGNMNGGGDRKQPQLPNGNVPHESAPSGDDSQPQKPPQQNIPDEQPDRQLQQKPGTGDDGQDPQLPNGNGQSGPGQPGNQSQPKPTPAQKPSVPHQQQPTPQPEQKPGPKEPHQIDWQRLLLILFLIAFAALLVWLVVRYRRVIAHAFRSFVAAVRDFFRQLFSFRRRKRAAPEQLPLPAPPPQPFSTFENPFLSGKATSWPPKRLILYTYEAIRGWAKDQRIETKPQETPREFCMRLCQLFPDFAPDLERFSYLYGYAAFADELPEDYDPEPIHFLWTYMGDSVTAISSR